MDDIGSVGESLRRTKDESFTLYNSCKQQYTRLYTQLEEANRKAYNMVESAESMQRAADAEYELAMRRLENAEDDSEREAANEQLRSAQAHQAEAAHEMSAASSAYAKAQANMKKLTEVWERYQPAVESAANKVEDGLSSFTTLVSNGNRDLGEYISIMDKAQAALYGDALGAPSSGNGGVSTSANNGAVTANNSSSSYRTKAGNTLGLVTAAGVTSIVMSIAGKEHSFPNTKSGAAKAYRTAVKSGDQEMIMRTSSLFKRGASPQKIERDEKWNTKYMPLVKANIRQSVATHFSKYVSQDKLEQCLDALGFMDQNELRRRYKSGGGHDMPYGTLGYNDGKASNIAHDMQGATSDGRVGDHKIQGSGNADINYAFVTAVHENLHMMSANDSDGMVRRGIMVGNDEKSRAMNEAFTEYFTYLSCGGETPLGGLYPGAYSGYQVLMQEMPTIEKAIGRDCMMDAYFNNKPEIIRWKIDSILGSGTWEDMCSASYDLLYNNNANGAAGRLSEYLRRLKQ